MMYNRRNVIKNYSGFSYKPGKGECNGISHQNGEFTACTVVHTCDRYYLQQAENRLGGREADERPRAEPEPDRGGEAAFSDLYPAGREG